MIVNWVRILALTVALPSNRIGNILTEKICLQHSYSKYCWDPSKRNMKDYLSVKDYTAFWSKQPSFEDVPVQRVVFHLRCGDILGDSEQSETYRLPCHSCIYGLRSWYKNATTALILAGGHLSSEVLAARCGSLAAHYAKVITKIIPHVSVQLTNTAEHDWHQMHTAERLVTLIPSSFSFSAKIGMLNTLKILGPEGAPWLHSCKSERPRPWSSRLLKKLASC